MRFDDEVRLWSAFLGLTAAYRVIKIHKRKIFVSESLFFRRFSRYERPRIRSIRPRNRICDDQLARDVVILLQPFQRRPLLIDGRVF